MEEEYLVSGTANVYDWNSAGKARVRTPDAPYTTRVLVRRPVKRTRMSGTVVVEPLNPSNLFDLNIGWALSGDQFMRNGDVWVGFTSKPVAVQALKTFDPKRYRALSWKNPLPLDDPRNCTDIQTIVDPPAVRSRKTEDGLVWDIFSQIGAWVKSRAASNPLAYGHGARRASDVDRAYGFGYSQTGSMLITYINAIRPRTVAADGGPIFDGYFVGAAGGSFIGAAPLNQCTPVPPLGDPRRSLRDAGVPVVQMMTQSDYLIGIASRGPDGNTPPDLYRHYEMAGAAHATPDELLYSARPQDILAAGRDVPPSSCDQGPRSRFPELHLRGRGAAQHRPVVARRAARAARPGHRGPGRQAGARRVRQRRRRAAVAVSSTCPRARGTRAPRAPRSAASPAMRCRSTRRCSTSSTRRRAPTSAPSSAASGSSSPTAT